MGGRFQNLILLATVIATLNLCEPAECTTYKELPPPPTYCEADDVIDAEQVPYFVDILLNPEVTFEEVCYSEKMLATGPMMEVIREMLPLLEFLYTEPEICFKGDASPQGFSLCPYPWPSARAAHRVYRGYLDTNSGPFSADLARQLLKDDEYEVLFPFLIRYLDGDWNEESESLALSFIEDRAADYRTRRYAASALLKANPWQYYELVLGVCEQATEPLRSSLAQNLVSSSCASKLGQDMRVVRLALEAIEKKFYVVPVDLQTSHSFSFSLRSYLEFESDLAHLRTPYIRNGVPYDQRLRLEIEEVIAHAQAYLRECEVSRLTNAGLNDSE